MSSFKVIVIGGSIAGLTLANILERYNIDYVLLEKYRDIAPQLGASIGVLPYGFQILEQLGVCNKVEAISEPIEKMRSFGPDGTRLNAQDGFGKMLSEITGYKMCFLDRRQLVQTLYDNLKDKSKVLVSREIFKIEQLDGQVRIITKDGTAFAGDLLVGADGVHSRTREEMWRIADLEAPEYDTDTLKKSIKCTYKCLFGIAERPDGIADDTGFKTFHQNRSYLYQTGPENKMYFFAFLKNAEKTIHASIPKYTAEDIETVAAEYGNDSLFPGLTFGDLLRRRKTAVLVPLHEYVLERCFYKRAIVIGDAFHKFNPLTGQGGNSAIESAGLLADLLRDIIDQKSDITDSMITAQFTTFQGQRKPRAKTLMEAAMGLQRMEALETRFHKFINLSIMSKLHPNKLAPGFSEFCSPGHVLQYLPPPPQRGAVAADEVVVAEPKQRSMAVTAPAIVVMLLIAAISPVVLNVFNLTGSGSQMVQIYTLITTTAVNGLWVVESYRPGQFLGPLYSATPYILASIFCGWEIILPIYFAIYIFRSHSRGFYYPHPRTINLGAAKSLSTGLLVAYILPILHTITGLKHFVSDISGWMIPVAHLILPVLLFLGERSFMKSSSNMKLAEILYNTRDMPHLSRFYALIVFLASTVHVVIASQVLSQLRMDELSLPMISSGAVQLACLTLAIATWCLFTVWDLHRVNVIRTSALPATALCILGVVLLGPGATVIGLWGWREYALEASRLRK
ncbi:hypothetical protein ASPWEDRAFT_180185 [Aspergillus wentii DTO 134E9]|uniref:FAD-binding domain-containing protein n=1 Tax=Aspergillus wentii DTO 134E9 TaxID=1073089 RepID=A0A1L9RUV8_ASPWE|nr:uncharacterized protein ASPWEDRAFT_180185 [Aspergillus wentii DTO 134E9]KAI9928584.1 hypothetical protein MW887_001798 [Aspergillus wentii]OJJ38658.1 hypothetical protein ASPWEDRAFT_180185 [Aspergillus wentii DTO 134E9]